MGALRTDFTMRPAPRHEKRRESFMSASAERYDLMHQTVGGGEDQKQKARLLPAELSRRNDMFIINAPSRYYSNTLHLQRATSSVVCYGRNANSALMSLDESAELFTSVQNELSDSKDKTVS